jgi:hypothetical protein
MDEKELRDFERERMFFLVSAPMSTRLDSYAVAQSANMRRVGCERAA